MKSPFRIFFRRNGILLGVDTGFGVNVGRYSFNAERDNGGNAVRDEGKDEMKVISIDKELTFTREMRLS